MPRFLLLSLGLLLAGLAIIASSVISSGTTQARLPEAPKLSGSETPRIGCESANGFNVCNYGQATIKDSWLAWKELLGEPLSSFDSHCQVFRFGSLCYDQGAPPGWAVQWQNLALEDLRAQGRIPEANPALHPAVRDWLISQMELGVDTLRVVGKPESSVVCDKTSGICKQWFTKTAFAFPAGDDVLSGSAVQRLPLGLMKVEGAVQIGRPTEPSGSPLPGGLSLLAGGILGAAALGLLFFSNRGGGSGRAMTI